MVSNLVYNEAARAKKNISTLIVHSSCRNRALIPRLTFTDVNMRQESNMARGS